MSLTTQLFASHKFKTSQNKQTQISWDKKKLDTTGGRKYLTKRRLPFRAKIDPVFITIQILLPTLNRYDTVEAHRNIKRDLRKWVGGHEIGHQKTILSVGRGWKCSGGNHRSHMDTNYFSYSVPRSTTMTSGMGCCDLMCAIRFCL